MFEEEVKMKVYLVTCGSENELGSLNKRKAGYRMISYLRLCKKRENSLTTGFRLLNGIEIDQDGVEIIGISGRRIKKKSRQSRNIYICYPSEKTLEERLNCKRCGEKGCDEKGFSSLIALRNHLKMEKLGAFGSEKMKRILEKERMERDLKKMTD